MKVTVEVSADDVRDMMRFSGEKRRNAAVAKFISSSLMLSRRKELLGKFASGEWATEGPDGTASKQEWAQS